MTLNEFKVVISKKNLIAFLCLFIVIEIGLIAMIIFSDYVLMGSVLAIVLLIIGLIAILSTVLFSVKVIGSTIKVRTRSGGQYEFNCSDIDEVICSKRDSVRYGPSFYITIMTKSQKLNLEGTMVGFQEMAGYILNKYENNEIRHTAVSENCKKMLIRYKNGDIFKKKK